MLTHGNCSGDFTDDTSARSSLLIVVIDDDPGVTVGVAAVLAAAGYTAERCHGYDEAVVALRRAKPDLVIADINLRGRSGLELCQQMRGEEGLGDVPWMFLSGAQIPDIIRRSHQAGGAYYLRKPFDPEVLVELVEKALMLRHSMHAHA